jgi:5-methylcytosine-specific restriction protein A
MPEINSLEIGKELNNDELQQIFKCSPQGGMRRSRKTNTLVIVSNLIKSIYKDRYDEGESILYYTGMGTVGDQSLLFAQNKTLAESNGNGVSIHWFEVLKDRVYTYKGVVNLIADPYIEAQPDANNNLRQVYV